MYKYIARQIATELEVIKLFQLTEGRFYNFTSISPPSIMHTTVCHFPTVDTDILAAIILKQFTPLVCRLFTVRNRKC